MAWRARLQRGQADQRNRPAFLFQISALHSVVCSVNVFCVGTVSAQPHECSVNACSMFVCTQSLPAAYVFEAASFISRAISSQGLSRFRGAWSCNKATTLHFSLFARLSFLGFGLLRVYSSSNTFRCDVNLYSRRIHATFQTEFYLLSWKRFASHVAGFRMAMALQSQSMAAMIRKLAYVDAPKVLSSVSA